MILAIIGALLTGVCLGLLGSGGSILTVPILVYILQRPEKLAIAESLAIVGLTALIGSIPYGMRGQIDWKSVIFFGIPGMIGAYLGAWGSSLISGQIQIILFAFTMIIVSWMMLWGSSRILQLTPITCSLSTTMIQGLAVGILTGLIGCGGGFIIVPALVLLSHLPMLTSLGTSLVIIACNALTGFLKQEMILKSMQVQVDWTEIMMFSFLGILGSVAGSFFSNRLSQERLKQFFGVFILLMAFFILIEQVLKVFM